MNTRAPLVPAMALMALGLLFWRQFALDDEIASLRAELHAAPPVAASPAPTAPVFVPASSPAGNTDTQNTLASLESRVADLEGVSSDMARIVNQALDDREAREAARPKASWSSAQAIGAPDTATGDDQATAWAPAGQDGGDEWLELSYNAPVEVAHVLVRETYNPGAISKVSVILENGTEVPIWQGTQQAVPGPIERVFPAPSGLVARGAKVFLDTKRVPGWNEIDAVAITDRTGTKHWASGANASSSYGDRSSTLRLQSSFLNGAGTFFQLKTQ